MIIKVQNEAPFQVLTGAFTIGPSSTGYELQVGATPQSFTTLFSVGANTTRMVTNVANGSYYRLKNNVGEVTVNWSRTCVEQGGGGGDMSNYYTKDETDEAIQEAISGISLDAYWTSAETKDYVDEAVSGIDLSNFYTSAQTEEAITSKGYVTSADTADFLDDEDGLVISSAINDLRGLIEVISAATPEVDLSGFWTSAETQSAITQSVSGKADAASVRARNSDIPLDGPVYIPKWNEEGIITGDGTDVYMQPFYVNGVASAKIYKHQRLTIPPIYAPVSAGTAGDILVSSGPGNAPVWSAMTFITSADVETQIEAKGYITSAYTADFLDDEDGLVISTALNDLDDRVDDVETSLATKVSSSTVSTIWKGTQAQYDAITTKDPATFYIIVSSN